jgi:Tol biopolymer transport system component
VNEPAASRLDRQNISLASALAVEPVQRISVAAAGTQAVGGPSIAPSLSRDGRFVTFDSFATNLVPGDTNGKADVFVYDRQLRQTSRVSIASDGTQGNNHSIASDISADGRYVAFLSAATNFVDGTTAGAVFVHDRQTGVTERVSAPVTRCWPTLNYAESTLRSDQVAISDDGRFVAYVSGGLIDGDVFVYDRQLRVTEAISHWSILGLTVAPETTVGRTWR